MSYTDLRDLAPEYSITITDYMDVDVYVIEVEKSGGGIHGNYYQGQWRYRITRDGVEWKKGQDFHSGMPITHKQAAIDLMDLLSDGDVTDYEFMYPVEEKYVDYMTNEWITKTA